MCWALTVLFLLGGIALLYYGAEWLLKGSVSIAAKLGVPSLLIGLTLVSFATSAPELVVSTCAAFSGNGDIATGNVAGSNICNIGLILGLSAMLAPMKVQRQLLRFDVPVLITGSLLFAGVGLSCGGFGRISGSIFLMLMLLYLLWSIRYSRQSKQEETPGMTECLKKPLSIPTAIALTLCGIAALTGGAHLLVRGSIAIGQALQIRDAVIGLTIIAIGTSLPELATSVVAAMRKEADIAIGNVIGSNIFNIFTIMGIAPLIQPIQTVSINWGDWSVMLLFAILLYPVMRTRMEMSRKEGILLFTLFTGYMIWIVCTAK